MVENLTPAAAGKTEAKATAQLSSKIETGFKARRSSSCITFTFPHVPKVLA